MSAESRIDPESSLGTLVAERPARAALFEDLRMDFCCAGHQTLTEACVKRRVPLEDVLTVLHAIDHSGVQGADIETTDWRMAGIAELCAHIVGVHHQRLHEALPRLARLLDAVVRAHGDRNPWLSEGQRLFCALRDELEAHLATEEDELFPAYVAQVRNRAPLDATVMDEHERDHVVIGHALAALRILCRDCGGARPQSNEYRMLLIELEAFERDLRQHVHEENNILLPHVREAQAPAAVREAQAAQAALISSPPAAPHVLN